MGPWITLIPRNGREVTRKHEPPQLQTSLLCFPQLPDLALSFHGLLPSIRTFSCLSFTLRLLLCIVPACLPVSYSSRQDTLELPEPRKNQGFCEVPAPGRMQAFLRLALESDKPDPNPGLEQTAKPPASFVLCGMIMMITAVALRGGCEDRLSLIL